MSLWTPGGEHPIEPDRPGPAAAEPRPQEPAETGPSFDDLSPEEQAQVREMQAEMDQVRQQLLEAPASAVVANHAMGLYELAAIHLTASEPNLSEAVLAIDGLAALVTDLEGRLGEAEATLQEALGQLRAVYLEVRARGEAGT
jgi:hypothetical protein